MASSSTAFIPSPDGTPPAPSNVDFSSSAHILEPIRKDGSDVLLYFLPGAFTVPAHYFPLLKAIQSRCGFRLWVVVLDPGSSLVMMPMVEASFDGVLERVKQMGFQTGQYPSQNIFFGGHSWGAWESRSVAMKRADGYIQLGSCFHTCPDNLVQYPKPVLTLCGELDGQITLAAIVKHAGEVYAVKDELGDYFVNAVKPVVIVPGMNHAQFSHCIPNKARGDLDALISPEQARVVSADIMSSFLTVHMNRANSDASTGALAVLTEAVRQTHELYKTFWEAIEEPGRDVKHMQLELAALPGLAESNIGVVQHDYQDNFVYSKPSISLLSRHITIHTYLPPGRKYNIINSIWVKMKSREAVAVAFENSKQKPEEPLFIGASFNERTFSLALALVPEATRRRFEQQGKKLRFIEDVVVKSSAQDWIDSDLIMKPAEDGSGYVDVQSTAIISPVQGVSERFAGMHYLKLLTVARAMEWIFMDCFR